MSRIDYARAIIVALLFIFFVKLVLDIHWYFAICFVGFIYMTAFWCIDIYSDIKKRKGSQGW